MILERVYLEEIDDELYIYADVLLNDKIHKLWYKTDLNNKSYVSLNNGDAFILILFIYAVFNNLKFESKVAISEELHYGLLNNLLPVFKKMNLNSELNDFSFNVIDYAINKEANASACAMSFGVDSLHTFFENEKTVKKIEIFTLFNAGAFGEKGGVVTQSLFKLMRKKVSDFADELNKEFIWVDTNTNEFLNLPFVKTHTFRNFACALLFQNKIKNYLYASGLTLSEFKLNIEDPAYYDIVNSLAIRANSTNFFISGLNTSRFEKTLFISNNVMVQKKLNVCVISPDNENLVKSATVNCSKCYKCIRTMITLDVCGRLEKFSDVFDLNYYKSNKDKFLGELLYKKHKMRQSFAIDIFKEIEKRKYFYSKKVYFYLFTHIIFLVKSKILK